MDLFPTDKTSYPTVPPPTTSPVTGTGLCEAKNNTRTVGQQQSVCVFTRMASNDPTLCAQKRQKSYLNKKIMIKNFSESSHVFRSGNERNTRVEGTAYGRNTGNSSTEEEKQKQTSNDFLLIKKLETVGDFIHPYNKDQKKGESKFLKLKLVAASASHRRGTSHEVRVGVVVGDSAPTEIKITTRNVQPSIKEGGNYDALLFDRTFVTHILLS